MEERKARDHQKKGKRSRAGNNRQHSGGFFFKRQCEQERKTGVEPGSLAQGEILNRLVYGPPLEAEAQPSVGTEGTPPPHRHCPTYRSRGMDETRRR